MSSGFIYVLWFRSKQLYLGSSINPEQRFLRHKQSCFSNKPANRFLANVWKKFGDPKMKVIMEVPAEKQFVWEQLFLDILFQGNKTPVDKACLNLNPFATRPPKTSNKGKKFSAEVRAKMSIAKKGKFFGKEPNIRINKPKSAEHKLTNNRREVVGTKGEETIRFRTIKEAAEFINRNIDSLKDTLKNKDGRVTCAGYYWSYADGKVREIRKTNFVPTNKRQVIGTKDKETIRFDSVTEASKFINTNRKAVGNAIKRNGTAGGYYWSYADEK